MLYIKKLVMYGFKSFPRKTELPFTNGINVVLGPNGSGKSNISDALCFVLGRLSIKSMRAAKAGNLIFLGTKVASPAKEAMVEIVFDNSDRIFSLDNDEVSIKRIVRRNGQSIYKINNQTKTRQEILTLLAQAGIDPNGFNIILQGEIQNFVRMHAEERRKVVEEVSGISIYEIRKEKSLKELDRTEEKLKEVLAILRERTIYLNNLEKERQQALKFKKLEEDIKRFKASIIYVDLIAKKKEIEKVSSEISKKLKELEDVKKTIFGVQNSIAEYELKINSINSTIQKSAGLEQEKLNQEIANLRAEIAGLTVKKEGTERKILDIEKQKKQLTEAIREGELFIKQLMKDSPSLLKQKDIEIKRKELEKIEDERKKFYMIKSELKSIKERFQDKNVLLINYSNESEFILKQITSLSKNIFDRKTDSKKLDELRALLSEKKHLLESISLKEKDLEKASYTKEYEIDKQRKLIEKIAKMDICPLCKNKITKEHIEKINEEITPDINSLKKVIEESDKELKEIYQRKELLKRDIEEISLEIPKRESDLIIMANIEEKKEKIKSLQDLISKIKEELTELKNKEKLLEKKFDENSNIEQKYETIRIEVQEISLRSEETLDSEVSFKKRELDRSKISLRQLLRDEEDITEELKVITKTLDEKEELLEVKRVKEEELVKHFQKLITERDNIQKKVREFESQVLIKQNIVHNIEQEMNNFKIEKARLDAERENFEIEMLGFPNVNVIKISRESLVHKLARLQEIISTIGSVNLRSLEVYDSIKKEYDLIQEKVEVISKEKDGILKIIHEIDIKKKKTFIKTMEELNEIFSRNFSELSPKAQVTLDLEDKKDPFTGGVNITVKTGHGKYFDVKSLSGGEQTLVALSLIFAIQELRPYYFYILDEIDAALDKRNSERLGGLLRKYMKKGQYIIITHNDEIISSATNLYGVSMHEGVSKVVSLKV